jgi:small subunit ribosomal protein S17
VVSDKMDKTVVVSVQRLARHRLYQRTMRRTKNYMAHDETNRCKIGDLVRIRESRPISRHKHWQVVGVLERAAERGKAVALPAGAAAGVVDLAPRDVPQEIIAGQSDLAGATSSATPDATPADAEGNP